jgi:hypothetical protein
MARGEEYSLFLLPELREDRKRERVRVCVLFTNLFDW